MPDDLSIRINISLWDENGLQYSAPEIIEEMRKELSETIIDKMSDLGFANNEHYDFFITVS